MARTKRDIDLFHDAASKEIPASLRALRAAIARPDGQTETRLQRELDRMERVAGAMADLAVCGLSPLQHAPVDLSALAHEEVRLLREEPGFAHVRFNVAAGLHAAGDRQLVASLVRHLVMRAARACRGEPEPLVQFGSGSREGRAVFFVRDSGPGIDAARREKLFRPFARANAPDGVQDDTADVGIVVAASIVDRHGGALTIDSRPGEGTTVYFSLPDA
jgi:signal transduction histidine kinase